MKLILAFLVRNCVWVVIIGIISGVVISLIPATAFTPRKHSVYNDFKFEQQGRFYEKHFKISKWKDKLPQFSEITHKGFSKGNLKGIDESYLSRFYLETVRAEFCHKLLILISPVFRLINEGSEAGIFATLLFAAGNIPFIMIQRYNRPRIKRIMLREGYKNRTKNKFVD